MMAMLGFSQTMDTSSAASFDEWETVMSSVEVLYVGICLSGSGRITQGSRMAELRPGEIVFVDGRRLRASLRPAAVE